MRAGCCRGHAHLRMMGVLFFAAVPADRPATSAFAASSGENSQEVRKATALSWVKAIETGDGQVAARLTSEPFFFRTAGPERTCEGRVVGASARLKWMQCVHARQDIREFTANMTMLRQAIQENPEENSELKNHLPQVLDTEGWEFHFQTAELHEAKRAFKALQREAGKPNEWTVITANWLYTSIIFRVQTDLAGSRVRAVLLEMSRGGD